MSNSNYSLFFSREDALHSFPRRVVTVTNCIGKILASFLIFVGRFAFFYFTGYTVCFACFIPFTYNYFSTLSPMGCGFLSCAKTTTFNGYFLFGCCTRSHLQTPRFLPAIAFLSLVNILAYTGFYLSKIFDIQLLK